VVPQQDNLDIEITVRENLLMYARYFDIGRDVAERRADELLRFVELADRANAQVDSLSGGLKRRLTIARALVNEPDVILLDEPTTGLDPQARHVVWERLYQLKRRGATLLLTTHYMDEAERLCERVAIMDHGKIIALGSPRDLVASIGVEHVVEFSADGATERLDLAALRTIEGVRDARADNGVVRMQVTALHSAVPALLAELVRRDIRLTELRTHSATLEDVFVTLTGRHLRDE
jgi:ABC-type multidrug transport system ATPase subunit